MLNGKELIENGVITGKIGEKNVQQHGIDLNLIKIERMTGESPGRIPNDESFANKTVLTDYCEIPCLGGIWALEPGTYSVTFEQGCKIPADVMLLIRQRSSLLRNGTILHSSVFDAGFETSNIGTVIVVTQPIVIEEGARIAQAYGHACTPVENLYDGQFQNDKQRKGSE